MNYFNFALTESANFYKENKMKLKLNKKKIKSLSSDKKSIPAAMTPEIAGGFDYQFSDIDCGRLTLIPRYTCGIGYTCPHVF